MACFCLSSCDIAKFRPVEVYSLVTTKWHGAKRPFGVYDVQPNELIGLYLRCRQTGLVCVVCLALVKPSQESIGRTAYNISQVCWCG